MIVLECGCGARFKARAESTGRAMKCSKCGAALLIPPPPVEKGGVAKPKERAIPESPTADLIPVRCTCGKRFSARTSSAGKKAKCPSCGQILVIPAGTRATTPTSADDDVLAGLALAEES